MTDERGDLTLYGLLEQRAVDDADAAALIWGDLRLTYGELHALVRRCAAGLLHMGVRRGDRVAMLSPPSWEQVVVFLAAAHTGAIFVGLNPRHSLPEHDYVVGDSSPVVLFGRSGATGSKAGPTLAHLSRKHRSVKRTVLADAAVPGATGFDQFLSDGGTDPGPSRSRPTDPVGVVYTSGSSGARKGALLTHRGLLTVHRGMLERMPLSHPVRCLNDLPIDHLAGLVERLVPSLLTGGYVVLHERFDPVAFLKDAATHKINFMQGEVTQWLRCVPLPEFTYTDLSCVEVALFVGAQAPHGLVATLCDRFPTVMTGWGMSETTGGVTITGPLLRDAPVAVVGRVLRGVELAVRPDPGREGELLADGEIVVRGPAVMPGYLGRPTEANGIDADGWLHTGDVGVLLEDGNLMLVGRRSDMYKSGGYNIYPREVEAALETHPRVTHAAVVSVPDPGFQEVGVAFVVTAGPQVLSPHELAVHCRKLLAGYKIPKQIRIVDELPLLANGKVDKPSLRALAKS